MYTFPLTHTEQDRKLDDQLRPNLQRIEIFKEFDNYTSLKHTTIMLS